MPQEINSVARAETGDQVMSDGHPDSGPADLRSPLFEVRLLCPISGQRSSCVTEILYLYLSLIIPINVPLQIPRL